MVKILLPQENLSCGLCLNQKDKLLKLKLRPAGSERPFFTWSDCKGSGQELGRMCFAQVSRA
jgi:hypothetical protein